MDNRRGDEGSAIVEFLGLSLLLLVPLIYLVVAMARVQEATYASEFAARSAARAAVIEGVALLESGESLAVAIEGAETRAMAAIELTADDFGIDPARQVSVTLACSRQPCFRPGSDIVVTVIIEVPLPGISAGTGWMPAMIEVSATSSSAVDDYARLS